MNNPMEKQNSSNINELILSKFSDKGQYFENISSEVWNFRNNSDLICQNWLKAHNGISLSNEDTQKYEHILMLLKEMLKLMEDIKMAIQDDHLKKLEIFEELRVVVAHKLDIEPEQVNQDANFAKDLGADSLDMLELIILLEEAFNIDIPEQVAETFITIKQVIDYINKTVDYAV